MLSPSSERALESVLLLFSVEYRSHSYRDRLISGTRAYSVHLPTWTQSAPAGRYGLA